MRYTALAATKLPFYDERDCVSNHRRIDCLLNRLIIKENIKTPRHWSLWGEYTGDRWIPLTKDQ